MSTLRPESKPRNPIEVLDETLDALEGTDHPHDRALLILATLRTAELALKQTTERLARLRASLPVPADDRGAR